MTKFPDALAEIMKLLEPPTRTVTLNVTDCDEQLDRMSDAFHAEADRWCWRRNDQHYELVRNSSPKNNIIDDEFMQITRLTKRECRDRYAAEVFLNTYRDRAAMLAALKAL